MRKSRSAILLTISLSLLGGMTGGCSSPGSTNGGLNRAQESFDAGRYDQAVADADGYLRTRPQSQESAAALYLKGRSYEEMTAANPADAQRNLSAARTAYVQALRLNPDRPLKARLQAAVANVAYHQEDYTTALQQWSAAYEPIDVESLKPWILYRIGLCQQRLGRFPDADRTYEAVKKKYPDSSAAARARQNQGARQFYVQLGVYRNAQAAERIATDARTRGVSVMVIPSNGNYAVRVGPTDNYAQAKALRAKVIDLQPDAIIFP